MVNANFDKKGQIMSVDSVPSLINPFVVELWHIEEAQRSFKSPIDFWKVLFPIENPSCFFSLD